MNRSLVVLALLAISPACAREGASAPRSRVPAMPTEAERQDAQERVRAAKEADEREQRSAAEARDRAAAASFRAQGEAEREKFVTSCASDRAERAARKAEQVAFDARRERADAWRAEHCVSVDDSPMVVRTYQDSKGNLSQRVVPDHAVSVRCKKDPKMPPEAAQGYSFPPRPVVNVRRNKQCAAVDAEAGVVLTEE